MSPIHPIRSPSVRVAACLRPAAGAKSAGDGGADAVRGGGTLGSTGVNWVTQPPVFMENVWNK